MIEETLEPDPDAWRPAAPDPVRALAADVILSAVAVAGRQDPRTKWFRQSRGGAGMRRQMLEERAEALAFLEGPGLEIWLRLAGYVPREIPAVADLVRRWHHRPNYRDPGAAPSREEVEALDR